MEGSILWDELYMGWFNNYVDQILPNFAPLPLSSGQLWKFYIIPTLCHLTNQEFTKGLSTDSIPPLLVHVVIEWRLLQFESDTFSVLDFLFWFGMLYCMQMHAHKEILSVILWTSSFWTVAFDPHSSRFTDSWPLREQINGRGEMHT